MHIRYESNVAGCGHCWLCRDEGTKLQPAGEAPTRDHGTSRRRGIGAGTALPWRSVVPGMNGVCEEQQASGRGRGGGTRARGHTNLIDGRLGDAGHRLLLLLFPEGQVWRRGEEHEIQLDGQISNLRRHGMAVA